MLENILTRIFNFLTTGPLILAIPAGLLLVLYFTGVISKPIRDLFDWVSEKFKKNQPSSPDGDGAKDDYRSKLVGGVLDGTITVEDAALLGSTLAVERYENAPLPAKTLPTGVEPAEEFIREFVGLATSKNKREREAAALDAEGKTEEALDLLAELADEESAQAAERWKARGAIAYNNFTAKAIHSYERAVGCAPDDAEAHNQLGHLYRRTGDLQRAQGAYEKVLALGNQAADKILLGAALSNLGNVELTQGNLDAAADYTKKALAIHKELGRKQAMATNYTNLGVLERIRGNLDAAVEYHQKSLEIDKELGCKEGIAIHYGNLGNVEQIRGNLDTSVDYFEKALAIDQQLEKKEGIAASYGNLGNVELTRGNLDAAVEYYEKALAIDSELGLKQGMAIQYFNLGGVEQTRGNLDNACAYWRKAHDLYTEIGMPHKVEKVSARLRDAGAEGFEKK